MNDKRDNSYTPVQAPPAEGKETKSHKPMIWERLVVSLLIVFTISAALGMLLVLLLFLHLLSWLD